MRRTLAALAATVVLCAPVAARAADACLDALAALDVPHRTGPKTKGIVQPIEVTGTLGGVVWRTWGTRALVLDCSLVEALARAGRYFVEAGVTEVFYSSAHQRRNIRGTSRPSSHSYGLAIDAHWFRGPTFEKLTVEDDWEQGLGDGYDCLGQPLTGGGGALRTVFCRMDRSGTFKHILTPDYDPDHHNHFHIEVRPWGERTDLSVAPGLRPH